MNEVVVGVIALLVLLGLFLTGLPLAFAMASVGFVGFVVLNNFHAAIALPETIFRLPRQLRAYCNSPLCPHGSNSL